MAARESFRRRFAWTLVLGGVAVACGGETTSYTGGAKSLSGGTASLSGGTSNPTGGTDNLIGGSSNASGGTATGGSTSPTGGAVHTGGTQGPTGGTSSGGVTSGGTASGGATSWNCLDGPHVLSQLASCSYQVPSPPAGFVVLTTQIEVMLTTSSSGTVSLNRAPNDNCSEAGQWFLGSFDANNSPTEIDLCPDSCAMVQSDSNASVSVQITCLEP
jgi:hypothetical protein